MLRRAYPGGEGEPVGAVRVASDPVRHGLLPW